jgi:hypothetical protein
VLETTSGSTISVNTSTGQITLTAGKTYRLMGMVPGFTSGGTRPQFCWYNETTAAYIGNSAEAYSSSDSASYGAFGGPAEAVITVGSTTVVSFRLLYSLSSSLSIGGNTDFSTTGSYPWIDVEELSSSFNLVNLSSVSTLTTSGEVIVGGNLTVGKRVAAGNEGGQIDLATAPSGNLSTGVVSLDIYQERLRIFENNGSFRGAYLDIGKLPTGVGGEIGVKVSGYVNAGTFLTMDNLKATVTTNGSRGLSLAAVSTTFTANISGVYGLSGGGGGNSTANASITTTASASLFNWSFGAEGDTPIYTVHDKTNSRAYRITVMIGLEYNNNFICIERLM